MSNLTRKQEGFVKDYLDTGNATQAALNNYDIQSDDPENVAGAIGSENLTKPKILAAIQNAAEGAFSRIIELSINAENENVKLSANKDIVDRAGFKPVDRSDITTDGDKINLGVIILPRS